MSCNGNNFRNDGCTRKKVRGLSLGDRHELKLREKRKKTEGGWPPPQTSFGVRHAAMTGTRDEPLREPLRDFKQPQRQRKRHLKIYVRIS